MTESEMEIVLPNVSKRKSLSVDVENVAAADTCQILDGEQTNPVNITFYNISRRVRTGIGLRYKRDWKYILHNLNGQFLGGELTGIIGPSGAGKSSLMDILSGYTSDYERGGCVQVNGQNKDQRQSCYIMQDDQLQPLFTVKESMMCAAHLKLGTNISYKEKKAKVNDILKKLNLLECRDTRTHQLSNGQRKLLAIALELVNNPPVMFFDEPTSGLDSWSSSNCLNLLKDLTCKGKTIICTIHQPSATLFQIFDHVYAIAQGHCVYQGSARGVVPFLTSVDQKRLVCPDNYNPADYMLDVCIGEYDDCDDDCDDIKHFDKLVNAIDNGKKWISVQQENMTDKLALSAYKVQFNDIMECKKQSENTTTQSYEYPTSFFTQLYLLVNRTFIKLQRDKFLTRLRIILHIIVGSLIGGLFYSVGRDAAYVFDNLSLLFFSLMFLMFTALSSMMMSFPSEMPIITREYFNRWYSLKSYYLALTVMDTPIQILCVLCYCTIVYIASQQPYELFRFTLFVMMCSVVSLVAQALGFLVGVLMEVQNGVIFGPLTLLPWVIFSGYFLRLSDAPSWLQWLFHISFLKYGLEGLLMSIYGYDRPKLSCSDDYCHFITPQKFLQEMEMNKVDYWDNFLLLFLLFFIIKTITFFVLLYQLNHKR